MSRLFISFAFLLFLTANAQVKVPAPSPAAKVSQTVGLTEVELQYNRPSAKGRKVFGDLVPFGKMWRTGANLNSMITFSDDVVIDGKTLPKGKYSIFATPKVDAWDIFFYKDVDNWGMPEKWSDEKVALSTTVKPQAITQNIESLTFAINHLTNDSAHLEISWEKTMVAIKFEVPTKKNAMASIEKIMKGPGFADYYSAAQYYFQSETEMAKALEYVNKAIELRGGETPFWYTRMKSQIQAKLGDKKGAIETAKASLASAEKAGNADYVKMNKDSIAEWSK
jgi:hypothetical protein